VGFNKKFGVYSTDNLFMYFKNIYIFTNEFTHKIFKTTMTFTLKFLQDAI